MTSDVSGDVNTIPLSYNHWIFKVVDNIEDAVVGQCDSENKTIQILETHKDNDGTLLHEIIHAYEFCIPEHYKQFLLLKLYEKLLPRIDNLWELILSDLHKENVVHTPLFLLKSLDLDLRLGWTLGTVYGYGREEMFEKDEE